MYYFIAALIIIINAGTSFSHFLKKRESAKIVKYTLLICGALGVAAAIYTVVSLAVQLKSLDGEKVLWAKDIFFIYVKYTGIFTAAVGCIVLLSSLLQPGKTKIRTAVCLFVPIVILLTAPVYSLMTESPAFNLTPYISLTAICFSLISPLFRFADIYRENNKYSKKSK